MLKKESLVNEWSYNGQAMMERQKHRLRETRVLPKISFENPTVKQEAQFHRPHHFNCSPAGPKSVKIQVSTQLISFDSDMLVRPVIFNARLTRNVFESGDEGEEFFDQELYVRYKLRV